MLPILVSPDDFHLQITADSISESKDRVVPIGSLVVEETEAGLVVSTRDGTRRFDIIEVFADALTSIVVESFGLFKPVDHSPRISFDRLIVNRESWRFPAADMAFAHEKESAARFVSARRWAAKRGIPRFVFVKSPVEVKPFFVDFDSPTFINIFAKTIRQTTQEAVADSSISISEMLPAIDQCWLSDSQGNRYTSELRFVAIDLDGVPGPK